MTYLGHIINEWQVIRPYRNTYTFVYECMSFWRFCKSIITMTFKLLSYCAFSCYKIMWIATRVLYILILCKVSFLITNNKHSFTYIQCYPEKLAGYMLKGKIESSADQKVTHGLYLSPFAFQSSSSFTERKRSKAWRNEIMDSFSTLQPL